MMLCRPAAGGSWRSVLHFRDHPLRAVRPGGQQGYAGPFGPEALLDEGAVCPLLQQIRDKDLLPFVYFSRSLESLGKVGT